MKPLRYISILLLVLFCLSSCDGGSGAGTPTEPSSPPESSEPAESSSADTTEEETTEEEFFDLEYWTDYAINTPLEPDRQDLPSYETLCKIELGMRIDKVYELIGNPQREKDGWYRPFGDVVAKPLWGCEYDSSDGESIWIGWGIDRKTGVSFVLSLIKNGKIYTYNNPHNPDP